MKESLRTFMNGLIDYAGLFPPADLPLNEAISEYISQIKSDNSQMLSRFIIHTSKLDELDEFLPLFEDIGPLRLSVLGGGDTLAAVNKFKNKLSFSHLSTAGGAFLEYLEGKDLPGISVLK